MDVFTRDFYHSLVNCKGDHDIVKKSFQLGICLRFLHVGNSRLLYL